MLFNSFAFAAFLPLTFSGYWVLRNRLRAQNGFVLVASYVFYGWWDWRFLFLIAFSSLVDFLVGLGLGRNENLRNRRLLLGTSLAANLGLLGFFKYFNFFAQSFADLLGAVGLNASMYTLEIILPVGISFYTFQTLSYSLDLYHRRLEPTRDLLAFLAYVSFFPQLVAGPIERATHLLPQFLKRREFSEEEGIDGVRQILWGLFKKMVVSDTCGGVVDDIFAHYGDYSSISLLLGGVFFAMQIYGDFSGYSDVAIGTARLFGFRILRNFAYPYFSRDIAEFWRRWHMSLSSWFRDYLYIPLGGNRVGRLRSLRNIIITFVVSGFWHGANWTFVVWGALNAAYFLPLFLGRKHRTHLDTVAEGRLLPNLAETLQMATTFSLTLLAWIFFRAESVGSALDYLREMVMSNPFSPLRASTHAFAFSVLMLCWEWVQREREHGLEVARLPRWGRWTLYLGLLSIIVQFSGGQREFIYFQF